MTSPVYSADGSRKTTPTTATPVTDDVFAAQPTAAAPDPTIEPGVTPTEPLPAEPTTEVVLPGEKLPGEWPHERLEFYGELLEVRVPSQQALAAFSLSSSKYVPMDVKNDVIGLFVSKHLSPVTYGHVMVRLMDPDDAEYTTATIGELMRAIAMMGVERSKELEAAEAATT